MNQKKTTIQSVLKEHPKLFPMTNNVWLQSLNLGFLVRQKLRKNSKIPRPICRNTSLVSKTAFSHFTTMDRNMTSVSYSLRLGLLTQRSGAPSTISQPNWMESMTSQSVSTKQQPWSKTRNVPALDVKFSRLPHTVQLILKISFQTWTRTLSATSLQKEHLLVFVKTIVQEVSKYPSKIILK